MANAILVNGKKFTSLQVKSTLALEYFITLKSNLMLLKYCNAQCYFSYGINFSYSFSLFSNQ